ncbi:MAG TPA: mechanosensitive ion channel domain-containing protein [Steroidobacteraceae bacterium]|nr:mechanosensitive ion channel domain-containing protein [Steroidobacteraceae bacterium]
MVGAAGVLGVAVGFGAQGFVRDVIAGMFYLMDDAFRVGEYISAGNYKGTVEGFSIRSVKLRHHRGVGAGFHRMSRSFRSHPRRS